MRGPDNQRHHLLLGQANWGDCTHDGQPLAELWAGPALARPPAAPGWDSNRHSVSLAPRLNDIALSPGDRPLSPAARRAAAADAAGNIYWIGDDPAQLMVQSAGDGLAARFWPDPRSHKRPDSLFAPDAPPPAPAPFTALAATCDAWLVAAAGRDLLAFDLIGGGPPLRVALPAGIAAVTALAAAPDGGLWLLERQRLWRIGAGFAAAPGPAEAAAPLFAPETGPPHPPVPSAPTGLDLAALVPGIAARDMAALPDGRLVLLSGNELLLIDPAAPALIDRTPVPPGVQAIAAGRVRLRAGLSDLRVVASLNSGNQAIAFAVSETRLDPTAEILPLRAHGGRALVNTPQGLFFDSGNILWAPIVEQPRRAFHPQAQLDTPMFDAGTPGTIWDRLFIDGCLPPGTRLRVDARAGDDAAGLGDWRPQPAPILSPSGSELVAHGPAAVTPTDAQSGRGSLVMLCQQLTGRYAQLRLSLASDGDASPHLFALRLHYPRVSWSDRFLPALYREDAAAGDFLSRWLANMNGITDQIDTRITHAQRLLSAAAAPADALDWLAGWFDVAMDPAWDELRRRAFIAHASRFFSWRGTMRGLTSALALGFNQRLTGTLFDADGCACDTAIRITEHYRTRTPAIADRLAAATAAVAAEAAAWDRHQAQRGRPASARIGLPALNVPAARADDWASFIALPAPQRALWQRFLAARWRRISALNAAHGAGWADFGQISLPPTAPTATAGRDDWRDYAATLLPIHAHAHRFSVLLPVRPGDPTDTATLDALRRLAVRLIDLEKPAHTIFDVRFYFAMNRIGEARLGFDTALGQGSRAPELLPPAILGRAWAGESFIGPDGPETPDRRRLAC